jgi:hypothetical protein
MSNFGLFKSTFSSTLLSTRDMSHFDRSSGQIYTEATSGRVRSMVPTWTTFSPNQRKDPLKHRQPGPGCSDLHSMALRSCAWNIDLMDDETFQGLQWQHVRRLYNHFKEAWVENPPI